MLVSKQKYSNKNSPCYPRVPEHTVILIGITVKMKGMVLIASKKKLGERIC